VVEAVTHSARAALVALGLIGVASIARGQCTPGGPPNPPATPRTITGIVMDSAHFPLGNADVIIRRPKRQVKTSNRGIFQVTDLEPGTYELTVRHIGHEIAVQSYVVTDSGGVARFCLFDDIQSLPSMVTSIPRGGLTGVVGDTALALVAGADVRVLGENMLAHTDSAGGFFFPVEPGQYSVAVKKKGYGPQVIGVTVPKDSGRKIVVWLGSPPRNPNTMTNEIEGMRMRILMTPAFRYHRVTTEDLAQSELSLEQLVRVRGRTNIQADCEAHIAGTSFSLPIYMIDKSDIALLEIATAPLTSRHSGGPTSINGNQNIATQRGGSVISGMGPPANCPSLIAWMKP
jgi:hypothetical protein